MKKLQSFVIIVMVLLSIASCQKEEVNTSNDSFSIKDINGEVIKSLPPDLLVSIQNDLNQNGRTDDANKLSEMYDFQTGFLKGIDVAELEKEIGELNVVQAIDSFSNTTDTLLNKTKGQYEPNGIFAYCHVAGLGDIGPFTQANYLGADYPYPYAGTVGQGRRLEGMWLQTESSLFLTRPNVYYSLRFPDGSWSSTATWGQFTGTRGQHKPTIGIKIWTNTSGYSIWYKAHNAGTGWNQPWHNDGQFAGIWNYSFEAFAFHILKY